MASSPCDDSVRIEKNIGDNLTDKNDNKENDSNIVLQVESTETPLDEFEDNSKVPHLSYWKIFVLFLDFGIHAWGGPVAQIALIKERLVTKGQWISHARFNRVYGVYQILPGPEATELCMFFGFLAGRGRIGGLLGGLGFIIPGFLLILLFSFIYVKIGLNNIYFNASFRALQPIVAAMVLRAVHKIGEHSFLSHRNKNFNYWLFGLAILSAIQSALNLNFLLTLAVCGIAFMFIDRKMYWLGLFVFVLEFIGFGIYIKFKGLPSPLSTGIGIAKEIPDAGHIFALGLLAGSLSFGGAYTTIPFLQVEAVTIGKWMLKQTFLDAIAIGQILPSPLVMFSTFIGYWGGYVFGGHGWAVLEALLISIGILAPCFFFTIMGHHILEKLVRNKFLSGFFDGITGSVVGIIAVTALDLLKFSITNIAILKNVPPEKRDLVAAQHSSVAAVLYVLSLAALYSFKKSIVPLLLVIFGAIAGQFLFVVDELNN
ncbi:chromate transporter-domain-containing protein [Glomus cerebriforme]|uniref:Chromate transporter-domain-containing protein n=1 Tax=Glomus cerebriforme TaxID=658196 RepID=A0A397TAZ9_9GLOM|nr:chromate transporter-domain-containing protein [Glomus cerebriforme]